MEFSASRYKRRSLSTLALTEETEGEFVSWWKALAEDPDYYTNTEEGKKELAEMIRKESERLLEEIGRSVKRTKEVIWLSRFCSSCYYFREQGQKMECDKWKVRIVKPFHGRAIWNVLPSRAAIEEKELVVEGIDWESKWKEVSDRIVEMAIEMVNGGFPYYCYKTK
jgi:hypothetical protein